MPLVIVYDALLRKVRTQDVVAEVASPDIDHTLIQNRGETPHTGLDAHVGNASNPHSVSATQVGINIAVLRPNTVKVGGETTPYVPVDVDYVIFCDTDNGAITINLRTGVESRYYKIINCGSSGNDVTVNPDGNAQIYGGGNGVAAIVGDGEIIDIHYNAEKGWW